MQSPFTLHKGVLERIAREAAFARAGKPARIIAKINALNEPQVAVSYTHLDVYKRQAQDPAVPLMERLRYLCISCTNLDEFFEIRGGAVRHAVEFGLPAGMDGLDLSLIHI